LRLGRIVKFVAAFVGHEFHEFSRIKFSSVSDRVKGPRFEIRNPQSAIRN